LFFYFIESHSFVPTDEFILRYAIDSRKLNDLGWFPRTEWKTGLQKTIDWYRDNSGNWGTALDTALRAHPNLPTRAEPRDAYDSKEPKEKELKH
jgi:hypothetical protein